MKTLIWLIPLAFCIPPRAFSQHPDPIYGLGICTSETDRVLQDVVQKSGIRQASPVPAPIDSSLLTFRPHFEEGLQRFINGDATLWKQHVSNGREVTIFGGWGAYEKGWAQVGPRYEWAAARFQDSNAQVTVQYISVVSSGDLAYTVSIERSRVRLADQAEAMPMALRVTHIFRREAGEWKLMHCHADPLLEKTAPAAVMKK